MRRHYSLDFGCSFCQQLPCTCFAIAIALVLAFSHSKIGKLFGQTSEDFWEQRLTSQDERASNSSLIRVHAEIENVRRLFIIDTGASHLLDDELKSDCMAFSHYTPSNTRNGTISLPVYTAPHIQIGKREIVLGEAKLIDLAPVSRVLGSDISGILGVQFAMDFGLGYDQTGDYFYMGRASVRAFDDIYPLTVGGSGLCTSDVELETGRMSFQIDTGVNTPMTIKPTIFDELKSLGLLTQLDDVRVLTLNDAVMTRFGIINSIGLWGTRFQSVPCFESSNNAIGLGLLKRFNFFINGSSETIEVSTHGETSFPFKWDRSGLSIIRSGVKISIDAVKPNSPADMAGLAAGHSLIAVNHQEVVATWQELHRLRDLFTSPGPIRVGLILESEGVQKQAELSW
jgi:predicted aspartyl protease